jgi:hypothetical protein
MADCEYHNLFPIVMIKGDVSSMSEVDHPLAKLRRHFFYRPANLRMLAESLYTLPDRFDGALCRVAAPGSQKIMKPDHVP